PLTTPAARLTLPVRDLSPSNARTPGRPARWSVLVCESRTDTPTARWGEGSGTHEAASGGRHDGVIGGLRAGVGRPPAGGTGHGWRPDGRRRPPAPGRGRGGRDRA